VSIDAPPLVDHHCHGVATATLSREDFEALATESALPPPPGTSHLDSPLGLAIRRWCAPVLDLEPLVGADAYLERRAELGGREASARLLRAAGVATFLLETGHTPVDITAPDAFADLAAAPVREVVRIERAAEDVLAALASAGEFTDRLGAALEDAATGAVGFKSIAAYRTGLALPASPTAAEVRARVEGVLGTPAARRLADPVLVRHAVDVAADVARNRRLPLQWHTGYGDADLRLDDANPLHLTPLLRELDARGVVSALLHCYPYHREAGYLAAVLPTVHFDVGLALPYLGPSSRTVLAEALELAPFPKQLYSSDAFGLAELYLVAARLFRRGLDAVLSAWIAAGDCTAGDADRIAALIGAGNARRIYDLGTGAA
jgi:hypothetical protein